MAVRLVEAFSPAGSGRVRFSLVCLYHVLHGHYQRIICARVATRTGEFDRTIDALQKLLSTPHYSPMASSTPLTPALLQLDPMFDPLRNDPLFEKLAASPAPKQANN